MTWFLSGFFLSLSLCLDLGIVNVAIIRTGVARGLLPSFLIGVGSSFGDLIYALLSMVGISLLMENRVIRWVLWLGGTLILLYMTWNMIKEFRSPKKIDLQEQGGEQNNRKRSWRDFSSGLGLALASPSAILWFATIGGSVIASSDANSASALLLFFSGFFTASITWSLFMAGVSSQGGKWLGHRLVRGFSFVSALLFLYFAGKVFIDGYHSLL
ncbi:lysine transporter LysE [Brevibacillus nitrificans]|uniref:Lysine transporter LysE n=1 Tax=Brevibacillus nitrificans TaxID=651560 RepID=A0A3M8D9U0_9BACL|nr:LysE family transporter [Brevibacillus nitrificans]RNB84107.1 lysine transporter LysE [Brevibacillus nitrificans]